MHAEQTESLNKPLTSSKRQIRCRAVVIEARLDQSKESLCSKLSQQGIEFLEVLKNTDNLLDSLKRMEPDVLIMSVDVLDEDSLQQLIFVNKARPLPVVVFAHRHSPDVLKCVTDAGIDAYVVDEIRENRIPVIIDLAIARFAKVQNLVQELQQTKEKLSQRKLVEKAKGIIMQNKKITEEQAYSQMRRSAMNQGQSIASLSERIISIFEKSQ